MNMKQLLLLLPLVLGTAAAAPCWACHSVGSSRPQSPDEETPVANVAIGGEEEGDVEPAAKTADDVRVAFHVTGMKKTKSGAT